MICDAYVAGLVHYASVRVPLKSQMVTVWPVESSLLANKINREAREKVCTDAVPNYGLELAQDAIAAAQRQKANLSGRGPFLLAWSPGDAKDNSDALVLVSDMSDVINSDQTKEIFMQWARDIQENPELWKNGWNKQKLRMLVRLWADKWGEKILKVVGIKE